MYSGKRVLLIAGGGTLGTYYSRVTGVKICWCSEEEYLNSYSSELSKFSHLCMWKYDRRYNRDIDCSKILRVTGLSPADFASVEEGIRHEIQKLQI